MNIFDNGTKCAAFWNHTNIRSGDRVFPCCRFKNPVQNFDGDVSKILFSEEYDDLRQKSLEGTKIKECSKCYLEEKLGKKSLRQEFNSEYGTDTISLRYLEIGFDNICNLSCDGCWGEWSSTWAKKEGKTVPIVSTTSFVNIPDSIEKIVFLGGEPLMTNRHIRFVKDLQELEKVSVVYYTNGTFLLKESDIEILKKMRHVKFIVSIDGVGVLNDNVRSGSAWNQILDFIEQITNLNFEFSIHSVLHKNNWFGFEELKKFIDDKNVRWTVGLLTYPEHLSIKHLSDIDKVRLSDIIEHNQIPNQEFILNYIKNENN